MSAKECPRDRSKLEEGNFHEVPVMHCPQCDGVLIKQMSLMTLLTEMAKELSQDISLVSEIEPVPDKGDNVSCPGCYSVMDNYGYMGSKNIMIDSCGQCAVLWIDTDELVAMCFMNEHVNKRAQDQQEAAKEQRKQLDRYVYRDAIQGAYKRGLVHGYVFGQIF
ncbi:MAG: zf-TFIIB domain-containing protein [Proteobacteria bacterium]|nr:zf-TFIIB domain-containing protein [Pseudomonadota bacterium]